MTSVARIGIDLAKDVFHAYAVDARSHPAKTLGLPIPQPLLARADEVIE